MGPTLASERTALAWTRSALNMAASGTLIARAAFVAHLDVLGVLCAVGMAGMAWFTWRRGRLDGTQPTESPAPSPRPAALAALTAATLVTAGVAIVVTLAI